MTEVGYAVVGLAAGVGIALVAFALVRSRERDSEAAGDPRIDARLDVQSAELRRLADGAAARDGLSQQLAAELSGARRALEEINVRDQERRARQVEESEVIRRLSAVLAGGASKGRAGENVLRRHLSDLPPGMLVNDFRVNGKVVEFGLLLSDGRRLPIDSKWPAPAELEALEAADEPADREACARAVERVVALRAREVAQYLDPALTAPVAVAAVPDAAYEVLQRAHTDAFARGVVIVPYSTALPITLFLYSLVRRFGDVGEVQGCLAEVASVLDAMESVLENKIARASTMLSNGADELRSHVGKSRGSLARARSVAGDELPAAEVAPRGEPDSYDGPDVLEIVR